MTRLPRPPCDACGRELRRPGGIVLASCPRGHLHFYCPPCRREAGYSKVGSAACADELRAALLLAGEGWR